VLREVKGAPVTRSLALGVVLAASLAASAEVEVRATSLVSGAPALTNPANQIETVVPLYELFGLTVRKIDVRGFDDVSMAFDGWVSSTLFTNLFSDGDVNVAYLEGLTFDKHLRLRLGRQIIIGGGSRMIAIDGLFAELKAGYGFGVSGFIGNPVVRRFSNYSHGDLAAGGRAFFAPTTSLEAGVSFTNITDRGAVVRQEVGADARWNLHRSFTLSGNALWSIADARLAEIDLGPRWQPLPGLEVSAGWRRTAPDLFLPRNSIFTVFADTQRDDLGGTVTYQVSRPLSLGVDGHAIWLNAQQPGSSEVGAPPPLPGSQQPGYEFGAIASLRGGRGSSLTAQVHRLSVPVNGYTQGRLAGRYTLPIRLSLFADLDLYVLDAPIRNVTTSFSWSAGATWAITSNWQAGLSVLGGSNPYYERHTELMAKLTYVFPEVRQ
jgi:hypothetical protein